MRTTPAENAEIGKRVAERLAPATAAVTVMIPHGGFSAISVEGQPFHDPAADSALIQAFKKPSPAPSKRSTGKLPSTIPRSL